MELAEATRQKEVSMSLKRQIELLHNSSERLMKTSELKRDQAWWMFMRREAWVHLKRSWGLWWTVLRRKE